MKKLFFIGIVLLCSCLTNAQDTIVKRNGDNILSKIIEISETEVKYKKFDFQDGPNFIENKSEIQLIKYSNGTRDEFKIQPNTISKTNESKTDYYEGPVNSNIKIESHKNRFRYNGKRINEPELHRILLTRNDPQITLLKNSARRYKKLQYVGLGGLAFGAAGVLSFAAAEILDAPALNIVGGVFIGVAVTLPIAAIYFKHKRNVSNAQAIELYNSKFQD
ncbi:MAG: hypothetical protein Q8L90_04530 [Bacteroidota bacterium]|nr:hypothetical protein [Bacteroidota bacterium]